MGGHQGDYDPTAPIPRILLTGRPGCGKTTVVRKVIENRPAGMVVAGFYTAEIRDCGKRLGFEAVSLTGGRCIMAHRDAKSSITVGRYKVLVNRFERFLQEQVLPNIEQAQLVVVDEIGKMECASDTFVRFVRRVLDEPKALLATVAEKGSGMIHEVKSYPTVTLLTVTPQNRDQLPAQLLAKLFDVPSNKLHQQK